MIVRLILFRDRITANVSRIWRSGKKGKDLKIPSRPSKANVLHKSKLNQNK
jgi:hypothetical protein